MNLDQREAIETASRDELETLQLQKLRRSLAYAYHNVPHYKEAWDAAGVHPQAVQRLQDLASFPFTSKEDLRLNYPFKMFAVPMHEIVRIHASSGTTGKPTVVGYTAKDLDDWANLCARSLRAAGASHRDVVHIAYGYGLFTGGLGAHYGAERLGCAVVPMSGGQTPKQVQLIQDFKPSIIMCTPSYMLTIADEFERQGVDPATSSLRIGIFGAEPWSQEMRLQIEQRCGLQAVDIFGLSEVMGPGVATEYLESKDGPTIWEDYFLPEIIDPESGEVLPDGEHGELVFTSLSKEAMPVVRYRTHDMTRLLPGSIGQMRRMDRITGRSDDMLIIRGVNVFPSQIEEHILREDALAPHYQLELYMKGKMDALRIHVELNGNSAGSETTVNSLKHNIKSYAGVTVEVEVHASGSLPRSEGKAVRMLDNR